MTSKKQLGIRVPQEVQNHLAEMARLTGVSTSVFVENLIESEWDKLQGSPKMAAMLEALRLFAEQVQSIATAEPQQQTVALPE